MKLLYTFSFLLFSSICFAQSDKNEYSKLLRYIIKKGYCATLVNGSKECIVFKGKNIFLLPYKDTVTIENLEILVRESRFLPLTDNFWASIDTFNVHAKEPLTMNTRKLGVRFVEDRSLSDMIITFSDIITIKEQRYCIVCVREKYSEWVFKILLEKESYHKEVVHWLD